MTDAITESRVSSILPSTSGAKDMSREPASLGLAVGVPVMSPETLMERRGPALGFSDLLCFEMRRLSLSPPCPLFDTVFRFFFMVIFSTREDRPSVEYNPPTPWSSPDLKLRLFSLSSSSLSLTDSGSERSGKAFSALTATAPLTAINCPDEFR